MLRGRMVRLIDTAGLEEAAPETLAGRMRASSATAVGAGRPGGVRDRRPRRADAGRPAFRAMAAPAGPARAAGRQQGRGPRRRPSSVLDAYALGLGEPVAVSAEHGEGIADLMAEIADRLPPRSRRRTRRMRRTGR